MKKIILLTFAILVWHASHAQKAEWIDYIYASSGFNGGKGVTADAAGNVYVLGDISTTFTTQGDTFSNLYGNQDILFLKYSSLGILQWGKVIGSTGYDYAGDIAIDASGHLYASIRSGTTTNIQNDTVYTASAALQIIQFNTEGNYLRHRAFAGAANDAKVQIATLGNHCFAAYFSSVEKMDSTLSTQWIRTAVPAGINFNSSGDIYVNRSGQLVVTCREMNNLSVQFDTLTLNYVFGNDNEISVIKMDTSGSALWQRTLYGATSAAESSGGAAIDDNGNVYLNVNSSDTVLFANDTLVNNVGNSNYSAILKFDAAGNPVWGIGLYGSGGPGESVNDLFINQQQDLIICGNSSYAGATLGGITIPSGLHTFIGKINGTGNVQWLKRAPESDDAAGSHELTSITANQSGNYIVTGNYSASPDGFRIGCHTSLPGGSSIMTALVSENPEPSAAFTYSNVALTYTFTDQSVGATSWDWDFGDGNSSTAQNPQNTYANGGSYIVTLYINDSLCGPFGDSTVVIANVGIAEQSNPLQFATISTNPFSDYVDIVASINPEGKLRFELADISGKMVLSQDVEFKQNNRQRIETSSLPNGVYFITLYNGHYTKVMKAVKINR